MSKIWLTLAPDSQKLHFQEFCELSLNVAIIKKWVHKHNWVSYIKNKVNKDS